MNARILKHKKWNVYEEKNWCSSFQEKLILTQNIYICITKLMSLIQ